MTQTLMDFSHMFKRNQAPLTETQQKPLLPEIAKETNEINENNENINTANEIKPNPEVVNQKPIIQNIVPRNLTITQEQMAERRCLDLRRWYCLSRPQYQRSCGVSSLVSVWNYLYSTLGSGTLPPISQEETIVFLQAAKEVGPHFNDVDFGDFTGNATLIKWFKLINKRYNVEGRAYVMFKPSPPAATTHIDADLALHKLKEGLKSDRVGYIYHSYDHYFCPIGYEITPNRGFEAYKSIEEIDMDSAHHWIIIGEVAKPYQFFTVRKWTDILQDLTTVNPQFVDIRKTEGIKERKGKRFTEGDLKGTTMHCIIAFEKVVKIQKKLKTKPLPDQNIEENTQPTIQQTNILEQNEPTQPIIEQIQNEAIEQKIVQQDDSTNLDDKQKENIINQAETQDTLNTPIIKDQQQETTEQVENHSAVEENIE